MNDMKFDSYNEKGNIINLKVIKDKVKDNINVCIECSNNFIKEVYKISLVIVVKKMGSEVLRYCLKQNKERLNNCHKFKTLDFCLSDGTSLYGRFDVFLMRIEDGQENIIARSKLNIDPKKSVYKGTNDFSNIVGTNYTNSSAVNQIQMWLDFDGKEIDRELGFAEDIGLNSVRVFLHLYPFKNNKVIFLDHIKKYLKIADRHNIKTIFVFFDDCWYGDDRVFTFKPIKGMHNGRWARCPLDKDRNVDNYPLFRDYIQRIIGNHKNDDRILAWEIWNEPKNFHTGCQPGYKDFTQDLLMNGFSWARELEPVQPVISCWDGNKYSDIDDQHIYCKQDSYCSSKFSVIVDRERGTLVTEAGARSWGKVLNSYGSPIEIIQWLMELKKQGKQRPGVFLTWELMVGNSNSRWHWTSAKGGPDPPVPWCGLFYPDGCPVSLAEVEAIRNYSKQESKGLFYCDFQDGKIDNWIIRKGLWYIVTFGNTKQLVAEEGRGEKVITTGNNSWKNYCIQLIIILADVKKLGSGIIFRVLNNNYYEFDSYFCCLTKKEIYLYKNSRGRSEKLYSVATSGIELNVKNSLKICVKNNNIKIYFNNPCNPTIDYIDNEKPILSGGIGLKAVNSCAAFTDIAVVEI